MIPDNVLVDNSETKTNTQEQQSSDTPKPLEKIFHSAASRIVDFLIIYRDFDYSEADIARKTHLTYKTVAREIPILLEGEIILLTRSHGRSKMYKINEQSDKVKGLIKFIDFTIESNYENYYKRM